MNDYTDEMTDSGIDPSELSDELYDELAELEAKNQRIQDLQTEVEDVRNQLLRSAAELQNFRRRAQQQQAELTKFAIENFVVSLLPVLDNFERTQMAAASGASLESLVDGVQMVQRQMLNAFEQSGVKRIRSVGQPFDPALHEALETWDAEGVEDGIITDESESGYVLNDRVIRPARVRVCKRG